MDSSRPAGIGHNNGPSIQPGHGFRKFCWTKSRRDLIRTVPLEIVRTRMRRARELGLAYPQYASVLTGSGRDVVAFLFTAEGLRLKLAKRLEMPGDVKTKLGSLIGVDRLVMAPEGEAPEAFQRELEDVSGIPFRAGAATLGEYASWGTSRRHILDILRPLKLPADAVVMVGTREAESKWANAAKLAKYLPVEDYFPDQP